LPFFQTVPLFGYAIAYVVLGQRLCSVQVTGGVLIVVGTLTVSTRLGNRFKLRLVLLMLCCGLAAAVSGQGVRHQSHILDDDILDVRRRSDFRRALLCVSSYRQQPVDIPCPRRRADRGNQSRRRLGQPLRDHVRAALDRAGDQLDDDTVRFYVRGSAHPVVPATWPRDVVAQPPSWSHSASR
jgi:hypothetical protein